MRLAEWLLLGLVTAGLVLVTPSFDLADQGTVGLVWGLVSGFSFAMLALTNRRAAAGMDPMQVACWQNAVVALVMLPFAVVHLPACTRWTGSGWRCWASSAPDCRTTCSSPA